MALLSLLQNHVKEVDELNKIKEELNIFFDFTKTNHIEKIRSLHSKRITIVKNTYIYIGEQLNHNFARVNIKELLKNINLQIEICRVNAWEYEMRQLEDLHKLIECSKTKGNDVIINEIRTFLGR